MDRNLQRSYSLEVQCAVGNRRLDFNGMVHPWAILLGSSTGSSTGWFVVPIARTDSVEQAPDLGQAGRIEWPELQGTNAETARMALAAARPDLTVRVVVGGYMTMDFVNNRVRIVSSNGKVAQVPRIG
jgi:hypothetical protein